MKRAIKNIHVHLDFLFLNSIETEECLAILWASLQMSPSEGFHHIGMLTYKEMTHNCMQDHSSQHAIKYF